MEKPAFDRLIMASRWQISGLWFVLILSMILNVGLWFKQSEPLTVLLPAEFSGPYNLTKAYNDESWLADSAAHMTHLLLNVTPQSHEWRRKEILRWIHPAAVGEITRQLDDESTELIKRKLSYAVSIKSVEVDRDAGTAQVKGVLTGWIASHQLDQQQIIVMIEWSRDAAGTNLIRRLEWGQQEEKTP